MFHVVFADSFGHIIPIYPQLTLINMIDLRVPIVVLLDFHISAVAVIWVAHIGAVVSNFLLVRGLEVEVHEVVVELLHSLHTLILRRNQVVPGYQTAHQGHTSVCSR